MMSIFLTIYVCFSDLYVIIMGEDWRMKWMIIYIIGLGMLGYI